MRIYMTLLAVAMGIAMLSGCGNETASSDLSSRSATLEERGDAFVSDKDIQIVSMQAWINSMPAVGIGTGGPRNVHLQVRFLAPSFGCTTGDNFAIKIVQHEGKQILVIKRAKMDSCHEAMFKTEINHTVEGGYIPGKPVMMNGEEIPVFESIIY